MNPRNWLRILFSLPFLIWGFVVFLWFMLSSMPFILISTSFNGRWTLKLMYLTQKYWAGGFSWVALIPTLIHGKVRDKSRPYIIVANHNSYLDAITIPIATPRAVFPLGKISLTKVPIFGILYKRMVVLIDRSSPESRKRSVKELKERLTQGQTVLIFPEGTMNRDPQLPLAKFYDGAFRIALETGIPILPMVTRNARHILSRNHPLHFRPGIMHVDILEPIETQGRPASDMEALKQEVFNKMEQVLLQKGT